MEPIDFRQTAPHLFKEDLDNGKELWLIQAPASVSTLLVPNLYISLFPLFFSRIILNPTFPVCCLCDLSLHCPCRVYFNSAPMWIQHAFSPSLSPSISPHSWPHNLSWFFFFDSVLPLLLSFLFLIFANSWTLLNWSARRWRWEG